MIPLATVAEPSHTTTNETRTETMIAVSQQSMVVAPQV